LHLCFLRSTSHYQCHCINAHCNDKKFRNLLWMASCDQHPVRSLFSRLDYSLDKSLLGLSTKKVPLFLGENESFLPSLETLWNPASSTYVSSFTIWITLLRCSGRKISLHFSYLPTMQTTPVSGSQPG
jgi:hypothetical protein